MPTKIAVGAIGIGLAAAFAAAALSRAATPDRHATPVSEVPGAPVDAGGPLVDPEPTATFLDTSQADTVRRVRTLGDDDDFGRIVSLQVAGGFLFVGDAQISPHVAAVDLSSGAMLARIGTHGEGPREFQSPSGMSLARDNGHPSVWVHDFYNRRVSLVGVNAGNQLTVGSSFPLMVATSTEDPEVLGEKVAAAGLYGEEAVLMFFDREGRPLVKAGQPPFSMSDVGHATGVRLVNRASMTAHPGGERLAVAFYSKNRLDLYDTEGRLLGSSAGPAETTTSFYVEDDRFFWTPGENQLAYTDVAATEDEIFLLFCGCTLGEESPTDRTRIHVFDWHGRFLRELVVPVPAMRIAVDGEGRNLFTAAEDPWPVIHQWEIPAKEEDG